MGKHTSGTSRYTDALDRAWRTFKQAILVDALVVTGGGVLTLMDQLDPTTSQFWAAAGGLALKSLLTSTASYFHRLKTPPKTEG